jgi:predicted DNA-binding protein (MmcQ/YjbR family)
MSSTPAPGQPSDRSTWHDPDPDDATLERLRAICLPFPETVETGGVASPSFKVRDKIFAMRHPMPLADGDRPSVWCKGRPGVQAALTQSAPERFAVPPYVGHRGWIAIYLDGDVDWDELADLIEESYRMTAPKRLIARLDAPSGTMGSRSG